MKSTNKWQNGEFVPLKHGEAVPTLTLQSIAAGNGPVSATDDVAAQTAADPEAEAERSDEQSTP